VLGVWTAVTVVAGSGGVGSAHVAERIVAVVGGNIILLSELDDRAKPYMGEAEREADPKAREKKKALIRREVLERMIDDELIQLQATDLKVQVTSEDIDHAVEDIKKQNNINQDQLVEALKEQGMTLQQYRQDVMKRQIVRLRVISIAVRSRVSVSDDDVKTYYEQNVRGVGADRKVRASHIFIAIPEGASVQVSEQKQALAGELVRRARAGEDFAKLAREYSEDPATRKEGGDLGWFGKGALPAAVEEIVFGMEPGDVRGPIRAERGFHVLKLVERKDESVRPFAEVKEQLRQALFQQEMEKQTRNWLQELRKKAHIDVRLDQAPAKDKDK
jgi:parvulin-like peptidyl-prolyl isomerase